METDLKRPRDENGWRIPKDGTLARRIYDLAKSGKTRGEIVAALPTVKERNIDGTLYALRNPEAANRSRDSLVRNRGRGGVSTAWMRGIPDDAIISRLAALGRQVALNGGAIPPALEKEREELLLLKEERWFWKQIEECAKSMEARGQYDSAKIVRTHARFAPRPNFKSLAG